MDMTEQRFKELLGYRDELNKFLADSGFYYADKYREAFPEMKIHPYRSDIEVKANFDFNCLRVSLGFDSDYNFKTRHDLENLKFSDLFRIDDLIQEIKLKKENDILKEKQETKLKQERIHRELMGGEI